MRGTPTYRSWHMMKQRCLNSRYPDFAYYGARGVTVCADWIDFAGFLADMGERPPGTSIDRIDNARGYEPGNCRWASNTQQQRNRSFTKLTGKTANAIRMLHGAGATQASLARRFGISTRTVSNVLDRRTWKEA